MTATRHLASCLIVQQVILNGHPIKVSLMALLKTTTPTPLRSRPTDGSVTTTQTVQVRVFDVNRTPQLTATNHAVIVGQSLSIPIQLGGLTNLNGITAFDPDGAQQTAALAVSFINLPDGASYDAQTHRLNWVPGPGQIGDFTVTARVSDGKNTATRTFTLRVVAEAAANQPKITVSTTPGAPALPGQTIITSVRADAWSGIASYCYRSARQWLGRQRGGYLAHHGTGCCGTHEVASPRSLA